MLSHQNANLIRTFCDDVVGSDVFKNEIFRIDPDFFLDTCFQNGLLFRNLGLQYRHVERVEALLTISNKCNNVLDVGCGHALLALEFSTRKKSVVGIDINSARLGVAKFLFRRYAQEGEFVRCDAHNLPFKRKAFDFSFCNQVMEHVDKPQKTIDEMLRVADKVALIYANDKTPLRSIWSYIRHRGREKIPKINRAKEVHYINYVIPTNRRLWVVMSYRLGKTILKIPLLKSLLPLLAGNVLKCLQCKDKEALD